MVTHEQAYLEWGPRRYTLGYNFKKLIDNEFFFNQGDWFYAKQSMLSMTNAYIFKRISFLTLNGHFYGNFIP